MATMNFKTPSELVPGQGELRATFNTSMGSFSAELFEGVAPNTVANFVGLSTGDQQWVDPQTGEPGAGALYTNVLFHRVIAGFMLQGGDPTGTGTGGPGYTFDNECSSDASHDGPGVLSMANRGPGTNGCQFFVTLGPTPHLNGRHTVFGKVVEGIEVVQAIGGVKTGAGDKPAEDVVLQSISISRV